MRNPFKAFLDVMSDNYDELLCIIFGHRFCRCRKCLLRIEKGQQTEDYCLRCFREIKR